MRYFKKDSADIWVPLLLFLLGLLMLISSWRMAQMNTGSFIVDIPRDNHHSNPHDKTGIGLNSVAVAIYAGLFMLLGIYSFINNWYLTGRYKRKK